MAVSQSGLSGGSKPSTGLILFGLVLLAMIIAFAAKNNRIIPVGPQPSPSVSVSTGPKGR